jgi:hypothetical protein
MTASAKTPERMWDKLGECRFFLKKMTESEHAKETQDFLYYLSAFMAAFRTVAYRLYGVTENRSGISAKLALRDKLHGHPEINFLLASTNVELHEDGVMVFPRFTVRSAGPGTEAADRFASRFLSRYGWRQGHGVVIEQTGGWQFDGNPKNIHDLCEEALEAIKVFLRQALEGPKATPAQPTVG